MMKVVLLTSTLSPAAGGLATSVPGLVHSMVRQGGGVSVVGVEDPSDIDAYQAWGASTFAHKLYGPKAFGYAPGIAITLGQLQPEVIDVQGLWTYASLANVRHHSRYGTPYVVTPRGMLDAWARRRSWIKKRAVRLWFEDRHLARANCLRATADMEADHFRSFGLLNPIAVVPNGVDIPNLTARPVDVNGRRRLLFLSRIHPKKGLPILLRAWAEISEALADWELVIAGPDELGHTAEMQALAARLRLTRIVWMKSVEGDAKGALYRSADVFVLPTYAENFGLVVAEALAHEVPVITTRNAPWSGLTDHRCGWWIDLTEKALADALMEATALPQRALHEMGARGRIWMERDFGWAPIAHKMQQVYSWVAGSIAQPSFVYKD